MADVRGTRAAVLTDPTTGTQQAGVDAGGNLKTIAAANNGVDIGDVTINGPLGPGVEAGAVLVTLATDSTGVMSVDDGGGTLTVDSGATFTVQEDGAALTALQLIDDVVVTDDAAFTAATGKGVPVMGFFSADTVDAGDIGALAMDASRRLLVSLEVDNVGIGGGVEYTEDAAAAADPVGKAFIVVRDDARAGSLTSANGDNVAVRGNNNGEMYVLDTDAVALLTTIDADTGTIAGDTTSLDAKITACDTGAVVISSGTVTTVSTVTNLSQLGGSAVDMNAGAAGAGTQRVILASDQGTLATTQGGPTNPGIDITRLTTPVSVAAGGSQNLDSADLVTKKLHQAHVAGAAPFKVVFATLANGVATNVGIAFGDAFHSVTWSPPHPDFVVSGSGAGADGFRAIVTNLDPADTTDFYAVFYYAD